MPSVSHCAHKHCCMLTLIKTHPFFPGCCAGTKNIVYIDLCSDEGSGDEGTGRQQGTSEVFQHTRVQTEIAAASAGPTPAAHERHRPGSAGVNGAQEGEEQSDKSVAAAAGTLHTLRDAAASVRRNPGRRAKPNEGTLALNYLQAKG